MSQFVSKFTSKNGPRVPLGFLKNAVQLSCEARAQLLQQELNSEAIFKPSAANSAETHVYIFDQQL